MLFFLTIIADALRHRRRGPGSVTMLGLNATSLPARLLPRPGPRRHRPGPHQALFSGFIIATVGCYFGMKTTGGTQGVGRATTQAVVVSSVFIIIVDLLVTRAMIGIFGS
jgi:phospholipid/cholesterol/gamma-HCH transport system permease protein